MNKPEINLKRKINFNGKMMTLFFLGLLLGVTSGSGLITVFGQERKELLIVEKTDAVIKSGEILGVVVLTSTPTPAPTIIPSSTLIPTVTPAQNQLLQTPTAVPTNSTPTPESVSPSSLPTNTPIPTPGYSGPVLPTPPEEKELLIISDSLPLGWTVEKQEKANFVLEEPRGQVLKVEEGGSLILSGGEIFVNSGTISFWLKLESFSYAESPILVWNFDGKNQPFSFEISFGDPQLAFSIYDEAGAQEALDPQLENPNSWHYVVATWDLTKEPYQRNLYVDGKKIAGGGFPFVPKNISQSFFQIGGIVEGRNPASFFIDELVLTNWAKSEEEIVNGN